MPADAAYGTERAGANFPGSLGNVVAHRKDLCRLFIQQQMIVSEVWATNVPMEAFGLKVQCENVGKQQVQRSRYLLDSLLFKVGWHYKIALRIFAWLSCGLRYVSSPQIQHHSSFPPLHQLRLPSQATLNLSCACRTLQIFAETFGRCE